MGFKKENYTPKGLCICICLFLVANVHSVLGQVDCPVRVDYEPREEIQTRSAKQVDEIKFPFFERWEDLHSLRTSNDFRAFVDLPANKRSTVIKGQRLGFSLPNGAQITGIEIYIEGHTSGEGIVEGQMLKLINDSGDMVGKNLALEALPSDVVWQKSEDSTDFIWRYGSNTEDWGLDLTEEMINSAEFGYALQVRNKLNQPVSVFIDHIQVVVYHIPLYEVCSTHPCVPFYIDEVDDPLVTYEWKIPEGFELISTSEEDTIINISPSYAEFGEYEICVEAFYKGESIWECCRKFNYSNCGPASISGRIFFDKNNDAINNIGDEPLEGFKIFMYDPDGFFIQQTTSDVNGEYSFVDLDPSQFYLGFSNGEDSLVYTTPNIGDPDTDSDVTGAFGIGTSDLFTVAAGDSITNIDAGYNTALELGDFVWEDLNGDGVQQEDEPGIFFAFIQLFDALDTFVDATASDIDGKYSFPGLQPGEYTIEVNSFIGFDTWIPTLQNNSDNATDSDIGPDQRVTVSYAVGDKIDSLDFGFYRPSTIGDFVWNDLNNNGIQDSDEPGIADAILSLLNTSDEVIQTTSSDLSGFYEFTELAPGEYYIEIEVEDKFLPTLLQADNDPDGALNSDVFDQDGRLITSMFSVLSNTVNTNVDLGFAERPASVGGFTFLDLNGNGQYDSDEEFVPGIPVDLYAMNGTFIESMLSDEGGFYQFDELFPGSYYVVFGITDDLIYTTANVGDDLSDSDVDNSNGVGSTAVFLLSPDEENLSISAGYQVKAKVGDFVWVDTNRNGLQDFGEFGLDFVLVELYTEDGEFVDSTLSTTHPESGIPGFYMFTGLLPGNYYIKVPELEDYDFTMVELSSPDLNSDITNQNGIGTTDVFTLNGNDCKRDVDPGYVLKNGSISGEVWIDASEDGIQDADDILLEGVNVSLHAIDGSTVGLAITDAEGKYTFTDIEAGNYFILFTVIDQYRFTSPFVGSDTAIDSDVNGENIPGSTNLIAVMDGVDIQDIDAGLIDGSVDINGLTWIDKNGDGIQQIDEEVLPNVQVDFFNENDSLLATTFTNAEGQYMFADNLSGTYYLVFTPSDNSFINTIANAGGDDSVDDDVTDFFQVGSTDALVLEFFAPVPPINAGYFTHSTIGDQVFIDENENGINDNEPGLNEVVVNLLDQADQVIATTTTTQGGGLDSGYYQLNNIPPGSYRLQFIRPLFYQFIDADQGGDDNTDSDVVDIMNNIGTTAEFTIMSGSSIDNLDAGVVFQVPMESSIAGSIWDDTNANGIQDDGEPVVSAIALTLENQDGVEIASTTSDENGAYLFDNLSEGFYIIKANIPGGKEVTYPNVGVDDTIDSDFSEIDGMVQTESFFLATFEDLTDLDLGIVNTLSIGDFVWEDLNNNGVQDAGELGLSQIELTLTSENGLVEETTFSDENGMYIFENLPAGSYQLCADLPGGFNFAISNSGSDLLDSDVEETGCTEFLDYTSGGVINDLDVGLTKNGAIEGIAFIDLNGNGVQNLNDPGLDGVIVSLYSSSSELLESTMTSTVNDEPGIFQFSDLKATDYYLVFEYPEDYIITNPDVGEDTMDSDITGVFGEGSTDLFSIPSGTTVTNVDGGAFLPASIGNRVWLDSNQDGLQDEGEGGVEGIEVIIFRSFGVPFDTTFTDQEGNYKFENLKQGLYFIQFMIPQEYTISPSDQGIDDNIDNDADNTGKTPLISLAHGADLESVDCGIFESMASLRSVVWNDINADGIRQDDEARIAGIKISLCDPDHNVLDTTQTNALGLYAFQELPEGEYIIRVDLSETDYAFTEMNMDEDDMFDSDIHDSGDSDLFENMGSNEGLSVPNVDAGLLEGGGIISTVWEDQNANGIFDLEEETMSGIEVQLITELGQIYKKAISSDSEENIQFNNVLPGRYFMKYLIDKYHVNSPKNGDVHQDNNSDVKKFEGVYITSVFEIKAGIISTEIDAGFYKGSTLKTKVWFDTNRNGLQDESGKLPYTVYATLFDEDGDSHGTRGTNVDGEIDFYGIQKGSYYIQYYALEDLYFTSIVKNDWSNSDVDHSHGYGTTQMIDFNPYIEYVDYDAGLIPFENTTQDISAFDASTSESETRSDQIAKELDFEVYPNPAANYLKITVDDTTKKGLLTIINGQNQIVHRSKASEINTIDLSNLHPGIYLVQYEVEGISKTKKIIKVK